MCKYLTIYEEAVSYMYDFATAQFWISFYVRIFFLSVRYPKGLTFVAGFYEIQRALVDLQPREGEQGGATVSGKCKSGNGFITPLPLKV